MDDCLSLFFCKGVNHVSVTTWICSCFGYGMSARPKCPASRLRHAFRPILEGLEERLVPYTLSGYRWAVPNVSASFLPDGTITDSGAPSNLIATLNAHYSTTTWQREFARALQTWADVSPLNFHFVADSGAASGTSGSAQGDSRFGDIRLGGYARSDNYVAYTYYPSSTTLGGDEFLATNITLYIGSYPDLYSVLLHESGHAIGLAHSTLSTAVMYPTIMGVYTGLSADDIAGIQAIYGARQPDNYDAAARNDTLATASVLSLGSSGGMTLSADLTSLADVDNYRVTAPASGDGTLTVSLDARNLSLLAPKVAVYDASNNLVATIDTGMAYGSVATLSLSGLTPGQSYTIMADGATSDVFGMGAYELTIQFGGVTPPPPPPPSITADRFEVNNTPATATNFGKTNSISQTGLTLHTATDVDYYTFTPAKSDTYTLSVTPTQGSGTLNLTLLNAQQAVIASSQSSTGAVTLAANLTAGQTYFVKVSSPPGSLFVYNFSMAKSTGKPSGGGGRLSAEIGDGTELAPSVPETTNTDSAVLPLSQSDFPGNRTSSTPTFASIPTLDLPATVLIVETGAAFPRFSPYGDTLSIENRSPVSPAELSAGALAPALVDAMPRSSVLFQEHADAAASLDVFWTIIGARLSDDDLELAAPLE